MIKVSDIIIMKCDIFGHIHIYGIGKCFFSVFLYFSRFSAGTCTWNLV